jgi:hypothetical protein
MIGKWILIFGVVLVMVGAVVWLIESPGLPLGRLPGDIQMRGEGWSFSFPIVTCILASIVLTVLLNLLVWFLETPSCNSPDSAGGRAGADEAVWRRLLALQEKRAPLDSKVAVVGGIAGMTNFG